MRDTIQKKDLRKTKALRKTKGLRKVNSSSNKILTPLVCYR